MFTGKQQTTKDGDKTEEGCVVVEAEKKNKLNMSHRWAITGKVVTGS